VDDLGGRFVDVPRDSGNAAVADRDIAALARGSRAVEEKTATDQNVMTRAQPVTGPLSSVLGCEPITLCRPCSSSCASRAFTPACGGKGPPPGVEAEWIDGRGGGERADAIEADARPLESAFSQPPARGRIAPPRAARHHVVTEIIKGVIEQRAHGFGGIALA